MSNVDISIDWVESIQNQIDRVNSTPLEEINWYSKSGKPIVVSKELLEYWKFTGLNNWDFAIIELSWMEE